MTATFTPKLGLALQELNDPAWTGNLELGFTNAEARLTLAGSGDPNGNVPGFFEGQQYFDRNSKVFWYCITPTTVAATTVWEMPAIISQLAYDFIFPIQRILLQWNEDDPNDDLPPGIVAVWAPYRPTARYLLVDDDSAANDTLGSSQSSVPLPNHVHSKGTLLLSAGNSVESGGEFSKDVSGNTGNPTTQPSINVEIKPRGIVVRLWRRTS